MKLSTRGRYGTRAMLQIALHDQEGPISIKDIAEIEGLPWRYLSHVLRPLIKGGILRSAQGTGGGISLTRRPEDIRLSEVVKLLEGSIAPAECVHDEKLCEKTAYCVTRDIWCEMEEAMNRILESVSIRDLVDRQKVKQLALISR
ncbi:RrF2 family transcriptional regulator [Chloroflexota bacterium]